MQRHSVYIIQNIATPTIINNISPKYNTYLRMN